MSAQPDDQSDIEADRTSGWDLRRQRLTDEFEAIAVQLMAQRGYDNVSYDDVAEAAGVSRRTVYRYFPTKEDFLLAYPRRTVHTVQRALDQMTPTRYPIDSFIEAMIVLVEGGDQETRDHVVLWHRAIASAPDVESRSHGEQLLALERMVLPLCADALDADPDDVGVRTVAATIAAVNQSVVTEWVASDGTSDLPTLYRHAVTSLRRSLRQLGVANPSPSKSTTRGRAARG